MLKKATPELIRKTGILEVLNNPEGIKQAHLFRRVVYVLSSKFDITEQSARNALWDLAEKNPSIIEKEKKSSRDVRLKPKAGIDVSSLLDQYIEEINAELDKAESGLPVTPRELLELREYILKEKVDYIFRAVLYSEIDGFIEAAIESGNLSSEELESLIGLKHSFEDVVKFSERLKKIWR